MTTPALAIGPRLKWGTLVAPSNVRNAIAKLVVECAADAKAARRVLRGDRRPKAAGWWAAGRRLGVPFQQLQKVCWGEPIRLSTLEKVHRALVAAGALRVSPLAGDGEQR